MAVTEQPGVLKVTLLTEHPAAIPGQVPVHVTTAPDFDWTKTSAAMRARGIDLEVLHLGDDAQNLEDLRRSEAEFVGDVAAKRHEGWLRMAELDAETIALRALLPQLEGLAPGRGSVQDPRLLEVQRIVAAESAFWRSVMTPIEARKVEPAEAPAPLPPGKAARVAPSPLQEPEAIARALSEARFVLGARRWIVARTSFARVRTLCTEVAAHATATADKSSDVAIAAKYRELAKRCTDAAQAITAACKP